MSPMGDHIVKSYDDELKRLNATLARMGGLAEHQMGGAIQSLVRRDEILATNIIRADAEVDALQAEVDEFCVALLARRQPMASDLRVVVSAIRVSGDLERIADLAANIAKRSVALVQMPASPLVPAVARIGRLSRQMIKDVLDAYLENSTEKAMAVWESDTEVDALYTSLFRELLTYMMEDPRNITTCTHLLFIAKNMERIGDHATNIAETVYFQVTGERMEAGRPKADTSPFAVVLPEDE